jgi:predicted AlkP superfamily phosphohydrolase/phosphomutase
MFLRGLLCALVLLSADPSLARVFVIGIDGGSWNVIDPMLEAGELPALKALIDQGGSANLETVEPLTSPVVWTSIATGRRPESHGITDFFSTRATIAVPTIYERLSAAGKRVGLYDVLMTWPPPPLQGGFVVPGWLRRDDTTWPPDAIQDLPVFRTTYQAKPRNRDYLEQALTEGATKARSWKSLVDRFDPEVGALTFYAVDATSHRYWHASFPDEFEGEIPPFEPDEDKAIQQSLRAVDRSIGEIAADLDLSGADNVIVVSDHGFRAADESQDVWTTRFEDLLAKHDLVPVRDGFTVVSTFFAVTLRIAPGPIEERDPLIERLRTLLDSYQTIEGESLMRTNVLDVAERPAGSQRSFLERAQQWAVRRAMDWVFSTKVDPTAQAMLVALPRGGALEALWPDKSILVDGVAMPLHKAIYRQRFTGTHDETAIFIAAGRAFRQQTVRGQLSVLDVAPLVAYLAGYPIPDDLEGKLPQDWIDTEFTANHPVRNVPAAEMPGIEAGGVGEDSGSEDPELVEKLRALGYIE